MKTERMSAEGLFAACETRRLPRRVNKMPVLTLYGIYDSLVGDLFGISVARADATVASTFALSTMLEVEW